MPYVAKMPYVAGTDPIHIKFSLRVEDKESTVN